MPTFRLISTVAVSAYTTVEADTLDDAINLAEGRPVVSGEGPYSRDEHWLVFELDGTPTNITADDE